MLFHRISAVGASLLNYWKIHSNWWSTLQSFDAHCRVQLWWLSRWTLQFAEVDWNAVDGHCHAEHWCG